MKKYAVTIGIDVSKSKLDVRYVVDATFADHHHLIVPNNEKGIKSIISYLKQKGIATNAALFCFENTGLYSMPLAIYCSKHSLDYWEIPALEINLAN